MLDDDKSPFADLRYLSLDPSVPTDGSDAGLLGAFLGLGCPIVGDISNDSRKVLFSSIFLFRSAVKDSLFLVGKDSLVFASFSAIFVLMTDNGVELSLSVSSIWIESNALCLAGS